MLSSTEVTSICMLSIHGLYQIEWQHGTTLNNKDYGGGLHGLHASKWNMVAGKSFIVASEPDACMAIVSTTSHAAIDDSRFTNDSTIAISDRQVAATLIPTTCELGSYVTCNGGGILLTLVVAITSFE
uniref:Uncharacterized protein n=1 Tax=Glossina austeni TaxID=7395 RepID=A0A1A9UGT5_GLOAU